MQKSSLVTGMFLTVQTKEAAQFVPSSPSLETPENLPRSTTLVPEPMSEPFDSSGPARRYRFGAYEADTSTGELRRRGIRLRLNAQPFQVLCLLLDRPGELLTRDEIARSLWPDGV